MIKLKYLESSDYKKVIEWNVEKSKDFLYQWAGPSYQFPITEDQLSERLHNKANLPHGDFYIYKVILEETGEMVGTIELCNIDREDRTAHAGKFLIDESQRGKGLGKLILRELVKICFDEMGLSTVTLNVYDFNVGAIKCYEKVGFIKKELKENVWESETGFWNQYLMEIKKEDFHISE